MKKLADATRESRVVTVAGRYEQDRLVEVARSHVGMRPVRSALTQRERETLDLLGALASTQQSSSELVVALETARSHIEHILRKLGVHSAPRRSPEPVPVQHRKSGGPGIGPGSWRACPPAAPREGRVS